MNRVRCNAGRARLAWCVVIALFVSVLAGCGAPGPLMPEQRSPNSESSRPPPAPDGYRVDSGDTLYSIAFGYGLDWRRVARWNGIGAPYTIHVGDWIRLRPPPDMRPAVVTVDTPRPAARNGAGTESSSAESAGGSASDASPQTTPQKTSATDPPRVPTEAASRPTPSVVAPRRTADKSADAAGVPNAATRSVAGVSWRWPASGDVARGFDASASRKGILISGQGGQPIRAAAAGEVVYSGDGLIGYGELIIVKHSPRMLSAYAHNRERLVGEGDRVSAGQLIARMGSNERDEEVLHFEIRRDGKPDDPVNYLPSR